MPWYALRTMARREFVVRDRLIELGHDSFVPSETRTKRRGRRRHGPRGPVEVTVPVIPGYVFVAFDQVPWFKLTLIDDIIGFVSRNGVDGKEPAPLPLAHVEALKALQGRGLQSLDGGTSLGGVKAFLEVLENEDVRTAA